MTVRQHLKKAHETIAAHHRSMSKIHRNMLSKESMGDEDRRFHEAAADAHDASATLHTELCEECAKAQEDQMSKLVPTAVSAVYAADNNTRMVTRAGQPQPATAEGDPRFQFLTKVDLD